MAIHLLSNTVSSLDKLKMDVYSIYTNRFRNSNLTFGFFSRQTDIAATMNVVPGEDLPPGWKRNLNDRGRVQYMSPPPVVSIQSKSQLLRHQKENRFLELDVTKVSFAKKQTKSVKSYVIIEGTEVLESGSTISSTSPLNNNDIGSLERTESVSQHPSAVIEPSKEAWPMDIITGDTNERTNGDMESSREILVETEMLDIFGDSRGISSTPSDQSSGQQQHEVFENQDASENTSDSNQSKSKPKKTAQHKIDQEVSKMASAVLRLTIDTDKSVDHRNELREAALILNNARKPNNINEDGLSDLKVDILDSQDMEGLVFKMRQNKEARHLFQQMECSSALEDFLRLSKPDVNSPLQTYPPDSNQNLYHEITKFSLEK